MNSRILKGCEVLPPYELSTSPILPTTAPSPRTGNATGRFGEFNGFVDFTIRQLSGNEIKVWLTLFRDTRNGTAQTSLKSIAERAGVCVKTVQRMMERLKKKGLVRVVRTGSLGHGASSYRVQNLTPIPDKS